MAESTLTLSVDELKASIGHYLGYGRGNVVYTESAWTTRQSNDIVSCLRTALNWVYNPVSPDGKSPPHRWSFLRPFSEFTLAAAASTITLPDSFGGFDGPLYIKTPSTAYRASAIQITNEGQLQHMHAMQPDRTGAPLIAAEQVIDGTTATEGTRYNLYVFPKADQEYILSGSWKHLQNALTGLLPYPPGGAEHTELFKSAAIAAAELELDDTHGERWGIFMAILQASMAIDNKKKGHVLGYNGDWSEGRGQFPWRSREARESVINPITFNGNPLS